MLFFGAKEQVLCREQISRIPVKCRGFFSRVFEASNRGQRL
jgi:hypothetical protein